MSNPSVTQAVYSRERGKIVSAAEAVRLIRDGDTVATGGFVGIGFAEEMLYITERCVFALTRRPGKNRWPR